MSWTRSSANGKIAGRCAHASIYMPSIDSVFVFGGWDGTNVLSDIAQFQVENSTWIFPTIQQGIPCKKAGHSIVSVESSNSFIVFGGSDGEYYSSDLFQFNVQQYIWRDLKADGTIPQPRSRHSSTIVGGLMYIYGGSDAHNAFNSLYVLDISKMKWSIPNCTGDTPPPSWGHQSVYLKDRNSIYFFGGNQSVSGGNATSVNGLSILDLTTMKWQVNVQVEGAPVSRVGHSVTLYNNKFILFGGAVAGDSNKLLNDTYVLDPTTMVWKQFVGDNTPTLRCAHTAELVNNRIFMFGGSDGHRYFKDISILDADKVLLKIDQVPKKRIRLRPIKQSNEATNLEENVNNNQNNNNNNNNNEKEKEELLPLPKPKEIVIIKPTPLLPPLSPSKQPLKNTNTKVVVEKEPPLPTTPPKSPSKFGNVTSLPLSKELLHTKFINQNTNNGSDSSRPLSPVLNGHNHTNGSGDNSKYRAICDWLNQLNLNKYESNFIENDITMDILEYITEQHLIEDLKIPTLGARLKILNAIQLQRDTKNNGKPKEKDEKELLRETIDSLKSTSDSLAAAIATLSQSSSASSTSSSLSQHNTPIQSPTLSGLGSRTRRHSNADTTKTKI